CSAFAGSPLLISPDELLAHGYLTKQDLRNAPAFPVGRVNYLAATRFKNKLLRRAFLGFSNTKESQDFAERNSCWLEPYANFSADGQRWGSPTYRWDRIAQNNFRWWIDRFRFAFEHLDLLRVDHFRGFEAFWSVPTEDKTARNGRWVAGPGAALFEAVKQQLGDAPIIAENLGVISPEVETLRNQFGFPGLAVMQFGFSEDGKHLPTNYSQNTVAFTGTHDNN